MLVLSRQDRFRDAKTSEAKSKVNIYRGGELLGSVVVLHAGHSTARLGFELPEDFRIVREEAECVGK